MRPMRTTIHINKYPADAMGFPKIVFKIVENRSCPLYEFGDVLELSGIAIPLKNKTENSFITTAIISYPAQKKVCKILNGDLAKLVIQYERGDKIPVCILSCSGCTGTIKIEHNQEELLVKDGKDTLTDELGSMIHLLSSFPFFKNIDGKHFDTVVS